MKKGEYFCGEDFFGKMVLYIPPPPVEGYMMWNKSKEKKLL